MALVAISTLTYASGGAPAATTITFTGVTNVALGQIITGTGISTSGSTYVIGISSNTVTLSQALTSQASGTYYTYATSATQTGTNISLGKIAFSWKGTYSAGTTYYKQDVVAYNGSTYVCLVDSTVGQTPATLTTYWQIFAQGAAGVSLNAGELIYNNGSGLVSLPAGTSGQVLSVGAGGLPQWGTPDVRSGTKVKSLLANSYANNNTIYRHYAVIMTDNSVRAWGVNNSYVLGDGSTNSRSYPGRVAFPPAFPGASKVWYTYNANGYCVDLNGQLWAWGDNSYGQCGTGNTTTQYVPFNCSAVSGNSIYGKTVVDVAVQCGNENYNSITVLCSDGTVHACGYNGYGQLGNGNTTSQSYFISNPVLSGGNVIKISGGRERYTSFFAVTNTGALYSWGYNGDGELATGDTTNSTLAVQRTTGVLSGKFIYDVTTGYQSSFSIGRSTTATATATYSSGGASGANTITLGSVTSVVVGQIVTGTGIPTLAYNVSPTTVTAIAGNVITLSQNLNAQAAGTYSFFTAGFMAGWGTNTTYGNLGNGDFANQYTPVQIFASGIAKAFCGNYDYPVSCVQKTDNTWWVAGAGNYGVNLDTGAAHRSSWVQITHSTITSTNYVTKVVKSGSGSYNWMAALLVNGTVLSWGYNGNGVLGIGGTTNQVGVINQVLTGGQRTVVDIAAFNQSSEQCLVMLMDDGQCWITGYGGSYCNTDDRGNYAATPFPIIF
jgi:alpha-tubulin suppressor-like RCC1 family protein